MRTLLTIALALFLGLAGPIAARAEIVSVPPAEAPSSAEALPPPTVLRGFPPGPPRPAPVCPLGYALSPDYGCMAPAPGGYAESRPGYDYWPDSWYGYPGFGFPGFGFPGFGHPGFGHPGFGHPGFGHPGFGHRAGHFHRFSGFRGFHNSARFGGLGIGVAHMGGFGRR